jgi:hypothetical protein
MTRRFNGQAGSDSPLGVHAPQDYAAHLVFDLDVIPGSTDTATLQSQFQNSATGAALPLVQGLQAIKAASLAAGADTNGALLGVHPGLKADLASQGSNVSAAVAAYLTKFLTPDRLSRVTLFGIPLDSPVPWQFFGGTVRRSQDPTVAPSFVRAPIPSFASPTLVQSFSGTGDGAAAFPEKPAGTANMASLLDGLTGIQGTPATPAERQHVIFGAFDLDHPSSHNALTTDCASCHTSQIFHAPPTRSFLPFQDLGDHSSTHIETAADLSPTRFVPPAGVSAYIATDAFDASGWNVHNLGYFGAHARVGERTLNETAAVVDLVNRLLAGDGHRNPGLDCGTDRPTLDQLYLCQLSATSDADRHACFAGCTLAQQPCTPTSCQAQGASCGSISDGCGGSLDCGGCAAPETCGGAGTPNVCGAPSSGASCATAYSQPGCFGYVQGVQVSSNGHNWTCTNGNCANCAGFASCAPGGSACPWGVVWTDDGVCN